MKFREISFMDREKLREYLNTRRQFWPYEDKYSVENLGDHRFIARISGELAGLAYAEIIEEGREAKMKMNLKSEYAEYGIGTELLELLMEDLKDSGYDIIKYGISKEHYAYQIYQNLGFKVESQDHDKVRFIWRR